MLPRHVHRWRPLNPAASPQIVVFIARVIGSASAVASYVEVDAFSSDSVAKLAERACTKCPQWAVAVDEVTLVLVTAAGNPTPAEISHALHEKPSLPAVFSLASVGVVSGSSIFARVPERVPPAAAPGASRRRG